MASDADGSVLGEQASTIKFLSCSSCKHWHALRYGAPFGQCMLSPKMGAAMAIITTDKASCSGWVERPE